VTGEIPAKGSTAFSYTPNPSLPKPPHRGQEKPGTERELRELAGLTVDELAAAVELRDKKVIEAVEAGAATLSFELGPGFATT